jgi:hypothetical protein
MPHQRHVSPELWTIPASTIVSLDRRRQALRLVAAPALGLSLLAASRF